MTETTEERLKRIEQELAKYSEFRLGNEVKWLVSELRKAQEDTARLGWINARGNTSFELLGFDGNIWSIDDKWKATGLRQAIDAARGKDKAK